MAEINPNLKRIAERILAATPMAERDWLAADHAAALVLRIREELEAPMPEDFKAPQGKEPAAAWRTACFLAAQSAINAGSWLYASNAKKDLAEAKIIPAKAASKADRYADLG